MNGVHTRNESGFMKEGILHCGARALKDSGDRFFCKVWYVYRKKFVYFSCLDVTFTFVCM